MTINGKRNFTHNGKKYYIADLPQADRDKSEGDKYYITIVEDDRYRIAFNNIGWNVERFKTIKDAQRYVRDWDFLLATNS